jgi:hypothetical protein
MAAVPSYCDALTGNTGKSLTELNMVRWCEEYVSPF